VSERPRPDPARGCGVRPRRERIDNELPSISLVVGSPRLVAAAASVEAHSCTRRQSSNAIGRSETPLIWQGYRRLPAAFRVTIESVPSPRFRPCLTACRSGVVLHPLPARFTTWPPTISHEMPTSRVPSPVDALLSSRDRRPKSQCNMSTATETALSWRDPAALDGRIRSP